jgi:THO complex subunit 7
MAFDAGILMIRYARSIASIQEEIVAIQTEREHKAKMMLARKAALDQIVSSLEALRQMDKEPDIQVVNDVPMEANAGEEEEGQQREDREDDRRDREREREARDREEDGDEAEETQVADTMLNPGAKPFLPRSTLDRLRDADHGSPSTSVPPSSESSPGPHKPEEGEEGEEHEDVEMGEVSETTSQTQPPINGRIKRRQKEELEEGEASDGSSALTEPPAT